MNTYRIDYAHENASVCFWIDARNIFVASVRGFLAAPSEFRLVSRRPATSFSVTRETV